MRHVKKFSFFGYRSIPGGEWEQECVRLTVYLPRMADGLYGEETSNEAEAYLTAAVAMVRNDIEPGGVKLLPRGLGIEYVDTLYKRLASFLAFVDSKR